MFVPARLAAAQPATDNAIRVQLLQDAVAADPETGIALRVPLFRALLAGGKPAEAIDAVHPILGRGRTLANLGLSAAGRARLARELGEAHQQSDRLADAVRFFAIALEGQTAAVRAPIQQRLTAINEEISRRTRNEGRRPKIWAGLDQQQIVRRRIPPPRPAVQTPRPAGPACRRPSTRSRSLGTGRSSMKPRRVAWTGIGVVLATVGALLQTPGAPPQRTSIAALLPGGATLVLQANDLASLVSDWNASAEKTKWLESANYQTFARSRLFLRLDAARDEFAAAAAFRPTWRSSSDGARSRRSRLRLGKLELLYVTRMPSAKTMENALWRTRGDYEPRESAGTPFYVREDPESERVVAFGVRDQYLVLATREDLVAGALALIGGQGGASIATVGWYAQAVKSAGAQGDLRLVGDLSTLARQPHFRTYWIQQNITELSQYSSFVSDLTRTPTEIREERMLLRVQEQPAVANAAALGDIIRLVPETAGLYRAWLSPQPEAATALIFEDVIATLQPIARRRAEGRVASGSSADLETHRLGNPRAEADDVSDLRWRSWSGAAARRDVARRGHDAAADGVFVNRGSVIVLARSTDWPQAPARRAAHWSTRYGRRTSARWSDERIGSQMFSRLEGLEPVAVAERAVAVRRQRSGAACRGARRPPGPQWPWRRGAAGFRHAAERPVREPDAAGGPCGRVAENRTLLLREPRQSQRHAVA